MGKDYLLKKKRFLSYHWANSRIYKKTTDPERILTNLVAAFAILKIQNMLVLVASCNVSCLLLLNVTLQILDIYEVYKINICIKMSGPVTITLWLKSRAVPSSY